RLRAARHRDARDARRAGRVAGRRAAVAGRAHTGASAGLFGSGGAAGGRDDLQRHRRRSPVTDTRLEITIGNLLRAGVLLAAVLVFSGGVWYLSDNGRAELSYAHFAESGGIRALLTLPGPQQMILAGLLVLIATPVARVVFSMVAFAQERDWEY